MKKFVFKEKVIALLLAIALVSVGLLLFFRSDSCAPVDPAELESADYWISQLKNADKVLMTSDEIKKYNDDAMAFFGGAPKSGYYNMFDYESWIYKEHDSDEVQEWIDQNTSYVIKEGKCGLYINGEPVSDKQAEDYLNATKVVSKNGKITPGLAIANKNSNVLDLPTTDELNTKSGIDNQLQETLVKKNDPVVVLGNNRDNDWSYIVCKDYMGWVETSNLDYFENVQEMQKYFSQDYLTVVRDYKDESTGETILLGTRFYGEDETGNENLVKGNMEFTRRRVIELAFTMLNDKYGWGGKDGLRDCSLFLRDIYSCFGLNVPRNTGLQSMCPGVKNIKEIEGYNEKEKEIRKLSAGDYLVIRGHSMMYLGETNDKHYVISLLGSYVPEEVTEDFANNIVTVYKCQVNSLDVHRANGNTWMEEVNYINNWNYPPKDDNCKNQ
ncbi:MAG: C40 family peptidase [Lachnospiraceae bacterium]|nr:C40 family peptidase [Lachnospiraceae bacterium]